MVSKRLLNFNIVKLLIKNEIRAENLNKSPFVIKNIPFISVNDQLHG